MNNLFDFRTILKYTLIFLGIFLVSYLGYLFPFLNNVIFLAIIFTALILSLKKLEYGVFIVLIELFIGVKGYLFSFNVGGFVLSLRIALFVLIFLVWLLQKNDGKFKLANTKFFPAYAILTVFIAIGIITALINGNVLKNIFFDINGYLYFALAFVIFDVLIDKEKIKKVIKILIASGLAIAILTLFVSAEFTLFHQDARPDKAGSMSYEFAEEEEMEKEAEGISHGITAKSELESKVFARNIQGVSIFRWTKDTGVGEITYIGSGLFRFFTPAQIYSLFAVLILLYCILIQKLSFKVILKNSWLISIIGLSVIAILIGFSRSLWLGLVGGVVFLLFNLSWKKSAKIVFGFVGIFLVLIIIMGTLFTPVYDILADRLNTIIHPSEQSSAVNRINLIEPVFDKIFEHPIIGSGFGTVIKYKSVVPGHAGTLQVFAFEWSYLDTIIEIGILGLIAYLYFLWVIFREGYKTISKYRAREPEKTLNKSHKSDKNTQRFNDSHLIIGLLATVFALIITNLTTPYLNHPLGIGYLLIICASIVAFNNIDNNAKVIYKSKSESLH
jgi:hypothetical protein